MPAIGAWGLRTVMPTALTVSNRSRMRAATVSRQRFQQMVARPGRHILHSAEKALVAERPGIVVAHAGIPRVGHAGNIEFEPLAEPRLFGVNAVEGVHDDILQNNAVSHSVPQMRVVSPGRRSGRPPHAP